jgi:hypothetical protein
VTTATDATVAVSDAQSVTTLFVGDDDSALVSATVGAATDTLSANVSTAAGSTCAAASFTHAPGGSTLMANFGSGCTLPRLGTVSGEVDIATTSDPTTRALGISFTFTSFVIAGKTYDGGYDLTINGRGNYGVSSTLTVDGSGIAYAGTAIVASGGVTLDGTLGSDTVSSVHHTFGACYADSGSVSFVEGSLPETITFDADTPTTGDAELTVGGKSTTVLLPSYGACPGTSEAS